MVIECNPEELLGVNDNIDKAVERIPGWQDRLDEVNDRLENRLFGGTDNNGFATLKHVLDEELEIIKEKLTAFKGTLVGAAECFQLLDEELAKSLTPVDAAPIPVPGGEDVAVP